MNKSETLTKLAPALVKAQATMAGAKKSAKNPFFKSTYANLEEVIQVVKTAFAENGLSFVQFPVSGDGTAGVETIIMHESGEFISNEFLLKCAKTDPFGGDIDDFTYLGKFDEVFVKISDVRDALSIVDKEGDDTIGLLRSFDCNQWGACSTLEALRKLNIITD